MASVFDQNFAELKKAHEKGIVVGLRKIAGVALRLDIDVLLSQQPDTFNLFLIALDELQNEEAQNIMGFYQIAGIHGLPKAEWFGIPGRKDSAGDPGYCNHGTETFPTWHRPYLAMLEQAIFIKMINIVNLYNEPLKTKFRDAAINFRLPYFDYFRPRAGPGRFTFPGVISNGQTAYDYDFSAPAIFTTPSVTVRYYPDGKPRQLARNPLHHYAFQAKSGQLSTQEWDTISRDTTAFPRDRTVRHPTASKPDNVDRLNSVLNELRMDSNRIAVTMVTNSIYGNYEIFSTNRFSRPTISRPSPNAPAAEQIAFGASGSLEAIHGLYHVLMGGWGRTPSGHMSQVPCAAFDPIFWAHHGNIERLFSVWQAVHANDRNNWFSDSGQAAEPLLPFLKPESVGGGQERFWSSNLSKKCEDFGYTFPDLANSNISIADRFRGLYAWSIPRIPGAAKQPPPANMAPISVSNTEFFKPPNAPRLNVSGLRDAPDLAPRLVSHVQKLQVPTQAKVEKNVAWDWFVDDHVERLALNTSFTISYFVLISPTQNLGPATDLVLDPTLIGVTHIFTSPVESCTNCASQAAEKLIVRNTVPFTSQLHDYIATEQLRSMEPRDVPDFLKGRLRWRIVKADGVRVDPRTIPSLKISVSAKRTVLDAQGMPTDQVEYHEYPELVRDIIASASAEAGHMAST